MDESLKDLNDFLLSNYSEDIISSNVEHDHLSIHIIFSSIESITSILKLNNICKFRTLIDITAVDFPSEEKRFTLVYHYLSMQQNIRIRLKSSIKEGQIVPSITNNNLPLDTIEALAWGSNLDWGFNKHSPASAFFLEVFYQIFGSQDWVFYFLSQIFVIISFYFVFKFAQEILRNSLLSLISVLLLESIYFYNFTTPEFNVNVCQLPFWSLVVYYSWKVFTSKNIQFFDCFLIALLLVTASFCFCFCFCFSFHSIQQQDTGEEENLGTKTFILCRSSTQ